MELLTDIWKINAQSWINADVQTKLGQIFGSWAVISASGHSEIIFLLLKLYILSYSEKVTGKRQL